METPAQEPHCCFQDVRKSGYLRKPKSAHRRFFVLRAASERGPARLECYESEKKFRSKAPAPKKALSLEQCLNVNKRADAKNKHLLVLYTRGESLAVAADSEEQQDAWYRALLDLHGKSRTPSDSGSGEMPSPGPAFKEVWQVKVWPKGLGQSRNLVGVYRLCLTDKTVSFVKLNSEVAAVVLQLMNVRRCGHSENFFFVEVGRSAVTGPGEFWMQVEDSVVAQNMHETLLEAMKALSEEFCQRNKTQSVGALAGGNNASNPISVPSRRHYPNPPPSQVGFTRRARTETPGAGGGSSTNTSPTTRVGFSRARTASIGARGEEAGAATSGACSSLSHSSSCSTTPNLRLKSRAPTPAKIPLSLACYSMNPGQSPAPSLSSSSGHGSECGLVGSGLIGIAGPYAFGRVPQNIRVPGSPSDYGSSDEEGCSIAEHPLLTPDLPTGMAGGLAYHTLFEEPSNYIAMGQRPGQPHPRRVQRRYSGRECETGRRQHSKRASLPPATLEHITSRRTVEEYAVMSRSLSRESFGSGKDLSSAAVDVGGYLDMTGDAIQKDVGGKGAVMDNGYMTMLPGVTSPPASLSVTASSPGSKTGSADDYMAMTPNNSVSPPRHIRPSAGSEGYMMMSPNSSCSPDQHGMLSLSAVWESRRSIDGRMGSDYMNMSPISVRSAGSTPPDQHLQQPSPKYSYCSLPRSYKHTLAPFEDGQRQVKVADGTSGVNSGILSKGSKFPSRRDLPVGTKDGHHLSLSSSSFSSSSASSESLEERHMPLAVIGVSRGAGFRKVGSIADGTSQQRPSSNGQRECQDPPVRRTRPSSFFFEASKANTLPRVRENTLLSIPPNPGDYVSIQIRGDREGEPRQGPSNTMRHYQRQSSAMSGFLTLPRSLSAPLAAPQSLSSSEYVNMDLGSPVSPTQPPTHGFNSLKDPPSLPAVAPKARCEPPLMAPREADEADMRHGKNGSFAAVTPELPTSCDYTEMAFGLGLESRSKSVDPGLLKGSHTQASSMELGLDLLTEETHGAEQNTRTIRSNLQGRRRHCSETFLALSSSSLFPKHSQVMPRRQGLDGVSWGNGTTDVSQCMGNRGPSLPAAQSLSVEHGLNYIDLDLTKKDNSLEGQSAVPPLQPRILTSVLRGGMGGCVGGASNSAANINTYASIDFFKSEELRTQHSGSKDATEF